MPISIPPLQEKENGGGEKGKVERAKGKRNAHSLYCDG